MATELPEFSPDQWNFLSLLEIFETSVSIEIMDTLAPLGAVAILDLMKRAAQLGIIEETNGSFFKMAAPAPAILKKLKAINTPDRISSVIDKLIDVHLIHGLDPELVTRFLLKAERTKELPLFQFEAAKRAVRRHDANTAITFLAPLIEKRYRHATMGATNHPLFSVVLATSELCFANGSGFSGMLPLLQQARSFAAELGDMRSQAVIEMNIGLILFLFGSYLDAAETLSAGKKMVESIGDEDIANQAAGHIGLFHFIKGDYKKAIPYFETSMAQPGFAKNDFINPFAPVFFSLSVLPFSQFHRAFTVLELFHNKAERSKLSKAAPILRAVLGYILLRNNKTKEAMIHLAIAQNNAREQGNVLALYWTGLFMSYYQFRVKKDFSEARNLYLSATNEAARANIRPAYITFPLIMDMVLAFESENLAPVPDGNLDDISRTIMKAPNPSLKGYLHRILAKRIKPQSGPIHQIQSHLEKSIRYLEQSQFKTELSRTRVELARLEMRKGNKDMAQKIAHEAWKDLPAYAEHFFPNDLQPLIENVSKGPFLKSFISPEVVLNRFSEIVEQLIPVSDLKTLLSRMIATTTWFLNAERGGLFLFQDGGTKETPQFLCGANLTEIELTTEIFKRILYLMRESVLKDKPVLTKLPIPSKEAFSAKEMSILCMPFKLEKNRQFVLYHDNSIIEDSFDFLDDQTLTLLTTYMAGVIARCYEYITLHGTHRISEETSNQTDIQKENIIGQSPIFLNLLRNAKQISKTNSHILIQGETGVGKELIARWIHKNSLRHNGPYVIIDATTIPGNLMESEFFGHEKGAFTGADRKKIGRVELADKGTLFLDEVGELPLPIQAKLLRLIEEKTFTRLGGSLVHQSDFRLIAATNRDLAREVQEGRFREDLFYRLNVLPLQIPALRERKEDIVPLARHFLTIYCKQLKRRPPPITPADTSALITYRWPGNIRELRNVIERAALLSSENRLELQLSAGTTNQQPPSLKDMPSMSELQRRYVAQVLEATGGRVTAAADILEMNRATLYSRMKKLGIPLDKS